ncbi:MAG: hypothetical protein IIA45_05870 [Bacteroidetes bacterium]|nr:hypothetical protein [Bacteroidota bacterium]
MRTALAETLLSQIMGWTAEEVQKERPLLQALSNFKYNEYQQYSPGMRFIESLVRWLNQIDDKAERRIAYNFIKSNLIFISSEQISHLVTLAFPQIIQPVLINKTAEQLNVSKYAIRTITNSAEFALNKRKSLFIGLSDGSKIDHFRRCNNISNEQIYLDYRISESKIKELINELKKDTGETTFNSIFLIDDFTDSGKSYFRTEDGDYKGKIYKFLNSLLQKTDDKLSSLVALQDCSILILFYVATSDAVNYIQDSVKDWLLELQIDIDIDVQTIQTLLPELKQDILKEQEFLKLCKKYYDNSIEDKHYKKGKMDSPFLGFNECSLPLILHHNTPNNSLPILWLHEDKKFVGLFPRVTRHQ